MYSTKKINDNLYCHISNEGTYIKRVDEGYECYMHSANYCKKNLSCKDDGSGIKGFCIKDNSSKSSDSENLSSDAEIKENDICINSNNNNNNLFCYMPITGTYQKRKDKNKVCYIHIQESCKEGLKCIDDGTTKTGICSKKSKKQPKKISDDQLKKMGIVKNKNPECNKKDDCKSKNKPECDFITNTCIECSMKEHCDDPKLPFCNIEKNKCIECLDNSHCGIKGKPNCDTDTNTCVKRINKKKLLTKTINSIVSNIIL